MTINKKQSKATRAEEWGIAHADSIIAFATGKSPEECSVRFASSVMFFGHGTYNAARGKRMVEFCINELQKKLRGIPFSQVRGREIVESCIKKLQERLPEIQAREADPAYKKARYGKR